MNAAAPAYPSSAPLPMPPPGPSIRRRGRFHKVYDSDHRTGAETRLPFDYSRYVYKVLAAGPGLSGPIPGLYSLHEEALAREVGRDLAGFREEWQKIEGAGIGRAEWSAPLVYLPMVKRTNGADSPKTVLGWGRHFELLPECALLEDVRVDLWLWMHLLDTWHRARDGSYVESFERCIGRRYQLQQLGGELHLVPVGLGHAPGAAARRVVDLLPEDLRAILPELAPADQVAVHAWVAPTLRRPAPAAAAPDAPAAPDAAPAASPAEPAAPAPAIDGAAPPAQIPPDEALARIQARAGARLLVPDPLPGPLAVAWAAAISAAGHNLTAALLDAAGDHLAAGALSWVSAAGVPLEWLVALRQDGGRPWAPNLSRLLTEASGRIASAPAATAAPAPEVLAARAAAEAAIDDRRWRDLDAALREDPAGVMARAAVQEDRAAARAAADRLGLLALAAAAGGADG